MRKHRRPRKHSGELPGEYLKQSLVTVSTGLLTEGGRIKDAHYIVKTTRLDRLWRVEVEHNGQQTVLPHKVVEQIIRHRDSIMAQQRRDNAHNRVLAEANKVAEKGLAASGGG